MSPKRRKPGDSWSELNPRMTFYCPRDLQATIRAQAEKSGLSVSELIVSAVSEKLPADSQTPLRGR